MRAQGLEDLGHVDPRGIIGERRIAEHHPQRFPLRQHPEQPFIHLPVKTSQQRIPIHRIDICPVLARVDTRKGATET